MAAPFPEQRSREQATPRATLTLWNDGLLDLRTGVIALTVALTFYVLPIFPVSVALAWFLIQCVATVAHSIAEHSRATAITNGRGPVSPKVPAMPRWAIWGLSVLLPLFLLLAVARLAGIGSAPGLDGAASPNERWWSLLGTMVGLLIVLRVWWRVRLRRHAVVGLVALAGALLGPALGLDWRDAIAPAPTAVPRTRDRPAGSRALRGWAGRDRRWGRLDRSGAVRFRVGRLSFGGGVLGGARRRRRRPVRRRDRRRTERRRA